jgi:hypothetical protein
MFATQTGTYDEIMSYLQEAQRLYQVTGYSYHQVGYKKDGTPIWQIDIQYNGGHEQKQI